MISEAQARAAVKSTGAPFARWESPIERTVNRSWWQTNREGPYALSELSANTRSKISRGRKRLEARKPTEEEILSQGHHLFHKAASRYGATGRVPESNYPARLAKTVKNHPENFDLFSVFKKGEMVALSENHIQSDGVLFESIWLEPEALRDYSSYVLFDAMLEHYLNLQGKDYVSDGVRTLHHKTGIHDFLIEKFGFTRMPCRLFVVYTGWFSILVQLAYPIRPAFEKLAELTESSVLIKISAILHQEKIRRNISSQ